MRSMFFITAATVVTLAASAAGAAPLHQPWPSADQQLKEIAEWMTIHQDLVASEGDPGRAPGFDTDAEEKRLPGNLPEKTTVGTNNRVSGAQTVPRSESDVRINFWNPTQVIAASNNIG